MNNKLVTYAANNRTYDSADIMAILLEISRDEAIIFLTWNDPNGVYMDLDCQKEGIQPLTETEAKLLCFKQLMENSEVPVNSKQAKCEDILSRICKTKGYNAFIDTVDKIEFEAWDGFEVHPVSEENAGTENAFCEQVDTDEEAHFFTVYAHLISGGLDAIIDCDSRATAENTVRLLEVIVAASKMNLTL